MMTAAKTTKTTPARRKTNAKPKPAPKAKAKPAPKPETQAHKEDDADLVVDCAERAADNQVRELVTSAPLYMQTLLEHAPGWYAEDDPDVVDDRADKLTSELLLLGGHQ